MTITLRGMTWSHPRGYEPLDATAPLYRDKTGIDIVWDRRSLQDFESQALEEVAGRYDLMVIDHPHIGGVVAAGLLHPLDGHGYDTAMLAAGSVGPSVESYRWQNQLWALPIDAAAQVQAWRPDRIATPVCTWPEVLALAIEGRVALPLRNPHALMVFYTLAANLGHPCASTDHFVDRDTGERVLAMMAELAALLDPADFARDPIDGLELLAEESGRATVIPYVYGYYAYARSGFRARRLAFADLPAAGAHGPAGSTLGGTGVAVSALSKYRDVAVALAWWLASSTVQAGPFARNGGQPAHADAWASDTLNVPHHDAYRRSRKTLDLSWLRPRHAGYMQFQSAASDVIAEAIRTRSPPARALNRLNDMFTASLPSG